MTFSIVICSIDDDKFTKISEHFEDVFEGTLFEIIRISDAKSLCEGYNRGLTASKGQFLLFSHDDIELLEEDIPGKLERAFTSYDVVGVAGTDRVIHAKWTQAGPPHIYGQVASPSPTGYSVGIFGAHKPSIGGMQALDGLFLGFKRKVIERLGWDEEAFDGFHLYDVDTTYRGYLAGYKLAVLNDLAIVHESIGDYNADWERYAVKFGEKHSATMEKATVPQLWQTTLVSAKTKLAVRQIMRPSAWDN